MRHLLAVVLALVIVIAVGVANIALMWFTLGWKFAFSGEGPEASLGWCAGMLVGGAVGSLLGGFCCRKLSADKSAAPVWALIALAVLLALQGLAVRKNVSDSTLPEGKTVGELTFLEASEYAVSPRWFHVANLLVGPGFIWCGSRLGRRR